MKGLNNQLNWSTIEHASFVMLCFGKKMRLIAGMGINVIGACVLLAHSARFVGWSI